MEEAIFKADFCSLFWNEQFQYIREEWYVANCSFDEFKSMNHFLLDFCIKKKVTTLIIDAFDAISLLPDGHHLWLESEFNTTFMEQTEVKNIITILPESLTTSISVNKFYDSIRNNNANVHVLKMKSMDEVQRYLEHNLPESPSP